MTASYQIQYLSHREIDKTKWDLCIRHAPNGLIYGQSFYLDCMAGKWDALVWNDYEAVMPLTWRKKWGIAYLYQPAFTQQLGVFCNTAPPQALVKKFLAIAAQRFRFAEIFLNFQNELPGLAAKTNFILSLNNNYETIYGGYDKDVVKNKKRSEKFNLQYRAMDNPAEAIALYKQVYGDRTEHVTTTDYSNFERLCLHAKNKKELVLRETVDDTGTQQAVALLLQQQNRLYLLQSTTLPEGRAKEANYFMIDSIIKEFSGRDMILDFEGSEIPGVAYFYKNFGCINQPYYFHRHNHLPWPLRLLK
jgi:hypothetical protein